MSACARVPLPGARDRRARRSARRARSRIPRSGDLVELADEAPTLHLYVVDLATDCRHARWRDPRFAEWLDVIEGDGPPRPAADRGSAHANARSASNDVGDVAP